MVMVSFEKAKEIVEKLNSGYGPLSLARECGISSEEIVKLPKFVEEKEKERKLKERLNLEQRKTSLMGEIEEKIDSIKEDIGADRIDGKDGRRYIRAPKKFIKRS